MKSSALFLLVLLSLTHAPLYAQADLPLVLQDLDNPASKKIGITQNHLGGPAALELMTSDSDGDLATRLLLRGDGDFHDIEFYRGARGSETLSMIIDQSGKVGIGTATPVSRLHVKNATGSSNGLIVEAAEGDRAALYYLADQGVVFDSFRPGDGRRLPVFLQPNGGRVGIGTNVPSSLLHVEGDMQAGSTTQTGAIRHYRSGFVQEAGLLSSNAEGGLLHLFDEAGNRYSYLEPDIDETGGFFAVRRSTGSSGFFVDGNYAGTENTRVTINGTSSMSFDASKTGDASVELPSDAVSSSEILDETGAAQSVFGLGVALSGSVEVVESATIIAPADGYVLAIGSGTIYSNHTNGTTDYAVIGVSADCDGTPTLDDDQDNAFRIPFDAPTDFWNVPFSAQKIFPVSTGAQTFCMVADEDNGDVRVSDPSLSLVFIPTAYGSVDQSILGGDGGGDDEASARQGGLTQAEIAQEQAASTAANQARIDRELAEMRARVEELERYLEQVKQEQGLEQSAGGR